MLPGPFLSGQKITAGQLNDATQKTIDSVEVVTVGQIAITPVGGAETNITQLAMSNIDFVGGALYTFDIRLIIQNNDPGGFNARNTFRIRRDTAVTGTIISELTIYQPNHAGDGYFYVNWDDITFASDQSAVDLFASIQRNTNTAGQTEVFGQVLGAQNRTGIALRRNGYASEFRTAV